MRHRSYRLNDFVVKRNVVETFLRAFLNDLREMKVKRISLFRQINCPFRRIPCITKESFSQTKQNETKRNVTELGILTKLAKSLAINEADLTTCPLLYI
jgi:hypothetical protein